MVFLHCVKNSYEIKHKGCFITRDPGEANCDKKNLQKRSLQFIINQGEPLDCKIMIKLVFFLFCFVQNPSFSARDAFNSSPSPLAQDLSSELVTRAFLAYEKNQAVLQSREPLVKQYLSMNSLLLIEACNPTVSGTA